jgi:hypothetical protein
MKSSRDEGSALLAAACLQSGWSWIADFLACPHPQIGRTGAICPFVEPAIRNETLLLRAQSVGPEAGVQELVALIDDMTRTFAETEWREPNSALHALVTVVIGLPGDRLHLLDDAHAAAKPGLVSRGLMLGQFHPRCGEMAARNPDFAVARSPVPMLALRHMAFHDVLFLHQEREWFASYRRAYGKNHERGHVADPLLAEVYRQAVERWGRDDTPDPA